MVVMVVARLTAHITSRLFCYFSFNCSSVFPLPRPPSLPTTTAAASSQHHPQRHENNSTHTSVCTPTSTNICPHSPLRHPLPPLRVCGGADARTAAAAAALSTSLSGESVEWVNMCVRKIWRVYQRGLERWITDLLQPVFDGLVAVRAHKALPWAGAQSWGGEGELADVDQCARSGCLSVGAAMC